MSITAVLLPLVTCLLTLPHTYLQQTSWFIGSHGTLETHPHQSLPKLQLLLLAPMQHANSLSTLVQHRINFRCCIQHYNTKSLYPAHIISEATGIQLQPNNMKEGLSMNKSHKWPPWRNTWSLLHRTSHDSGSPRDILGPLSRPCLCPRLHLPHIPL
jgi:hypothetical protein